MKVNNWKLKEVKLEKESAEIEIIGRSEKVYSKKKKKFKIFPDKIIELIGVFELVMEKKQEQQLVEKTTRR